MNDENRLFGEGAQQEENTSAVAPADEQPQNDAPAEEAAAAEEVTPVADSADEQPQSDVPAEEVAAAEEVTPVADSADEQPQSDAPAEEAAAAEEVTPVADSADEQPQSDAPAEEAAAAEEGDADEASEATVPATEPGQAASDAESQPDSLLTPPLPYHERYYLRYREGKRTAALDLDGTKTFLQDIGFDGGELRQARKGKDCSEMFRNFGSDKTQMRCSYCGTEIAGVEFYRLPDGRIRCTACNNSVVKTKAEVEELCQRVINNLDNFFGATIDVPISIEVMDELKLKKRLGMPLGTIDSQSVLILGVAINKKKKYSVYLENGAPRLSLIATFAHELTHIWQYTHWDNNKEFKKKCPKNKRLLIYEGMAKWAEIQYLYLIGETAVAKREEYITRNRQDEYGIGFCLYEAQYPLSREAMSCDVTPFTATDYPIEL